MEPFKLNEKQYLHLNKWEQQEPKLVTGFTIKAGGVSKGPFSNLNLGLHVKDEKTNVLKNREIIARKISFPLSDWVLGEQVHGIKIKHITSADRGKGATSLASACKATDGLVTQTKGVLLAAFFADCIPLYFIEPEKQIIGIAHAGWKGTVGEIATEMVRAMEQLGANKQNILVTIGPGISQSYYEVDERVANEVNKEFSETTLKDKGKKRYLLDLKGLNREILLKYGLLRHNIDITNYCTHQNEELFYSHRRDQGETGRMLGFIGFNE